MVACLPRGTIVGDHAYARYARLPDALWGELHRFASFRDGPSRHRSFGDRPAAGNAFTHLPRRVAAVEALPCPAEAAVVDYEVVGEMTTYWPRSKPTGSSTDSLPSSTSIPISIEATRFAVDPVRVRG